MSSDRAREIRLSTARELEERGFVDKAVQLYVKAGAPGEAARLLVSKERYRDAGQLMLDALGVLPDDVGKLEGPPRNAAAKAARCFALGGDQDTANRILRALGMAEAGGAPGGAPARPSMPPDVLPRTEPVPSLAPPPASTPPASGAPPASPSVAPIAQPAPTTPSFARPSSAPSAQPTTPSNARPASAPSSAGAQPAPPATTSSSGAARSPSAQGAPAASRSASSTGTPAAGASPARSPSQPRVATTGGETGEKWGRAAGWRAGQVDTRAVDQAIQQLVDQGKPGQAGRVAWDAGRLEDAARLFEQAGLDYESGAVLLELDRVEPAIERLVRVPADHKRHRSACAKLVDAASRLDRFDFEIDRALARFTKAPPIEASELPTYLRLADLYARHGFPDGARRALDQILLFDASHAGARAALERIGPAPADKSRRSEPRPPAPSSARLPPLPALPDFLTLARQHAPKKP